jgi:tetratricopeptide (TPR) repeat protein
VLAVDKYQHNPGELFALAVVAEETGDVAEAERLYRIVIKGDPKDAAAPFNLGNMLRACGCKADAESALRAATRLDLSFAEAWYNLSDLLDQQGRSEAAVECLRTALRVAPDYIDAMFNLALLLQRKNQYAEAAGYWRHHLAANAKSEWATRARRSLKFCEMQVHLLASA